MNDRTLSPEPEAPRAPLKKIGNLRMVFERAVKYPKQIAFALLALFVSAMATLAIPAGFKTIIDKGFMAGNGDVAPYFQGLLAIVAVLAIATAFRFYFVSWLGERVVADIRLAVQRNLLRLAPGFFEENRPSEIASRMTSDTAVIEQVVGTTVSVALRNIVIGLGGIIYLFTLAPALTAGLLLAIPVIVLPIVFIGRKLTNVSRSSQDRVADVGAMIAETLGAMKIVQAFGQQNREHERFRGAVENTFDTAKRRIRLRAAMTAIVIGLIFTGITMLMWRGAIGVAEGSISGGTIAAFVLTGGLVAGAFGALTEVYGDLLRGAGAAGRLADRHAGAPQFLADRLARRDRRSGRSVRRRQIDPVPARPALLRSTGGLGSHRRGCPALGRSRRHQAADGARAAGDRSVCRIRARQSALRQMGSNRRRNLGGSAGRQCREIPPRPSQRTGQLHG